MNRNGFAPAERSQGGVGSASVEGPVACTTVSLRITVCSSIACSGDLWKSVLRVTEGEGRLASADRVREDTNGPS